jgi:lipopolysaccharide biosynthesis glycosyltransferase
VLKDFAGEYRKVILLDLDLLVRKDDIDSLFELRAPAAMVRGQNYLPHGAVVPIDTFYSSHRQTVGINCGVMMVEPNSDIFDLMLSEVTEHYKHPEHWPSHGPEQDYLSRFYNAFSHWTNMSCRYNYQVHLMKFGSLEWHHYNRKGFRDVSVFHFSGRLVKPWEILLDLLIVHDMSYNELIRFVETIPDRLRPEPTPETEDPDDSAIVESTHFCYGNHPGQRPTKKCYLHRYIHPSWTSNDSDAVIEWIHAFKSADEETCGSTVKLLKQLWERELATREEGRDEL